MRCRSRRYRMDQCSATLLGCPCQEPSHDFHHDIGCACRTTGKVGVAEPWIDCIDDDQRFSFDSLFCNLSHREELQKLRDLIAAGDKALSRIEAEGRCEKRGTRDHLPVFHDSCILIVECRKRIRRFPLREAGEGMCARAHHGDHRSNPMFRRGGA